MYRKIDSSLLNNHNEWPFSHYMRLFDSRFYFSPLWLWFWVEFEKLGNDNRLRNNICDYNAHTDCRKQTCIYLYTACCNILLNLMLWYTVLYWSLIVASSKLRNEFLHRRGTVPELILYIGQKSTENMILTLQDINSFVSKL